MSDYYEILSEELSGDTGKWVIRLLADADVYRGHFPGHPIAPGACNIEMIRRLASRITKTDYHFHEITQCRFTHLITPQVENPLDVEIRVADGRLQAIVNWNETSCIKLTVNN